jgi:DNA polymerase I-like protein with 3'-5' exonuclease and polymerase domains
MAAVAALKHKLCNIANRRGEPGPTKQQLRYAYKGSLLREAFYKKFPALPKLMKAVEKAAKKGWIKGLDGRRLPVRHAHAALNLLLQSAGAVICKQWIVDVEDALIAAGLKHGWQGDFVILGWIHDELQIAVREGLEDQVSDIVLKAARAAGDPFPSWRCPTDGDCKIGRNWAECH